MAALGSFDVEITPQDDTDCPAGRMLINKTYSGGLIGSGLGQMISKRTDDGTAVYYAIEEFLGTLDGRRGGFTLVHRGFMNAETQSLEVTILEGSGSGELEQVTGSMTISQEEGGHNYELSYEL